MLPKTYTSGQVAKILRVAPRTVQTWIDQGILKGYRLPNGSKDRRVLEPDLINFAKDYIGHTIKADLNEVLIQAKTLTDLEKTILIRRLTNEVN
jgi:excisionase family DNA binding protein